MIKLMLCFLHKLCKTNDYGSAVIFYQYGPATAEFEDVNLPKSSTSQISEAIILIELTDNAENSFINKRQQIHFIPRLHFYCLSPTFYAWSV